jgi:hypothetical protein
LNPLQRALVEKVGVDNGFEHTLSTNEHDVTLASARHSTRSSISVEGGSFNVSFTSRSPALLSELRRSFPQTVQTEQDGFAVSSEASLAVLLRRASGLSRALPNQAATHYRQALDEELASLPPEFSGTEVERMVRQRVGQQKFREAMLDYWGGACAVTGVAVPEILRASHAKPWAECESDIERLDVFNGFLLTANLDALFDRFLISFDEQGRLVTSSSLAEADLRRMGILPDMELRWVADEHQSYLAFHRARFGFPIK